MKIDKFRSLFPKSEMPPKTSRSKPRHIEAQLQETCVRWFHYQYPQLGNRLFHIPNGGSRNVIEAANLKRQGVLAGVADLCLLMKSAKHGALFIEMKTADGRLSERQKAWRDDITKDDEYKYVVCRSLADFIHEVEQYLIYG